MDHDSDDDDDDIGDAGVGCRAASDVHDLASLRAASTSAVPDVKPLCGLNSDGEHRRHLHHHHRNGGVAQWLGRRSLTGGLSLICA